MSRMYNDENLITPVTILEAGPITVTDIKTVDKDGYAAVQVGYGMKKKATKALAGHLKKTNSQARYLAEFRGDAKTDFKPGDVISADAFAVGQKVKVTAISKSKGFQGAVKRHGFAGMPASHGHHHVLRHVGSIGQRFPQHTLKGLRMAGHMGGDTTTTRGLTIMHIDTEHNLIAVKGAVPGRRGSLVKVSTL